MVIKDLLTYLLMYSQFKKLDRNSAYLLTCGKKLSMQVGK